jgi:hypothetical protein
MHDVARTKAPLSARRIGEEGASILLVPRHDTQDQGGAALDSKALRHPYLGKVWQAAHTTAGDREA